MATDINSGCAGMISFRHGNAVSVPRSIVGKRHCRVLILGNINSGAAGNDMMPTEAYALCPRQHLMLLRLGYIF